MSERAVRLVVTGRVQGVGYRDFLRREAEARALSGWVRNRRDGAVEAVAAGAAEAIDALIEACRRGPAASRVLDLEVETIGIPEGLAAGFAIHPTV